MPISPAIRSMCSGFKRSGPCSSSNWSSMARRSTRSTDSMLRESSRAARSDAPSACSSGCRDPNSRTCQVWRIEEAGGSGLPSGSAAEHGVGVSPGAHGGESHPAPALLPPELRASEPGFPQHRLRWRRAPSASGGDRWPPTIRPCLCSARERCGRIARWDESNGIVRSWRGR